MEVRYGCSLMPSACTIGVNEIFCFMFPTPAVMKLIDGNGRVGGAG